MREAERLKFFKHRMQSMVKIKKNIKVASLTTFGIGGVAKFFCVVKNVNDLKKALDFAHKNKLEVLILGGGSNILLPEKIDDLVIKIDIKGIKFVDRGKYVLMSAGAGENWDRIVEKTVKKDLSGIENLSLIPGSVGAAVYQNIGAYGAELKNVLLKAVVFDTKTDKVKILKNKECKFGYRDSVFQHKDNLIILDVMLKLNKKFKPNVSYVDLANCFKNKKPSLSELRTVVIKIRKNKFLYPDKLSNAGSFFKNPIISGRKVSAAQLIEKAGWKGRRLGRVGVSPTHSLVIVNYGGARASEVINLASKIQRDVFKKFGIKLEPEVKIVKP